MLINNSVPKDWPSKSQIEFKNLSLKYGEGLDFVLKSISATINGKEKIGKNNHVLTIPDSRTRYCRKNWCWKKFSYSCSLPSDRS